MIKSVKTFFHLLLLPIVLAQNLWKTVAVVEYQAIDSPDFTPEDRLNRNADEYIKIIKKISINDKILVIVFPEATLDNVKTKSDLPLYATKITPTSNPCTTHKEDYPIFLQKLSCAASRYRTTIVFNLIEESYFQFYTSDVVINAAGIIELSIRRERRIGVEALKSAPIPFAIPARRAFLFVKKVGEFILEAMLFTPTSFITGFSFSFDKIISLSEHRYYLVCSNWVSQLPFLTSLQVYQMWAQEFEITVLFSSANNPKSGQGGTGVYHDGPVLMDIVASGGTRVYLYHFSNAGQAGYITQMENKSTDALSKEMDTFYLEVDPDLDRYKSIILDPRESQFYDVLCYNETPNNNFCCEFDLSLSFRTFVKTKKHYTYHLVAYKGRKTYYNIFEPGGVEVCAVIACLDSQLSSCGKRFDNYEETEWPLTFTQIVIKANFSFPLKEKIYYSSQFPTSLLSSIRPIHPDFTNWTSRIVTNNSKFSYVERTFALIKPQTNILTFGIFGRNFSLVDPRPNSGYNKFHFIHTLLIVLNCCVFIL